MILIQFNKEILDSIKSAEILTLINEKHYNARMGYMGPEKKTRSLDKSGISLCDLSKIAHVKHTQISAIEKGQSNSAILTLIANSEVLDLDLCEISNYKFESKRINSKRPSYHINQTFADRCKHMGRYKY